MAAPLSFLAAAEQCLCGLELEYSVNLLERAEHRCQVEMRIRGINHPYLDLSLPAWNNLYQLRNFVDNLSRVTASNADGEALEVRRIGSHTWRIKTDSVDSLSLRYRVFANLPGDFYSLIDENHAFLNGANIFLYLERHRGAPSQYRKAEAGEELSLKILRDGQEQQLNFQTGKKQVLTIEIRNLEDPSPAQRRVRKGLLEGDEEP